MKAVWRSFCRRQSLVQSFAADCDPADRLLVAGATIGTALIVRPELGGAVRPSSGGNPTDLVTTMLVAGNSFSIVVRGDYAPHTTGKRLLFFLTR